MGEAQPAEVVTAGAKVAPAWVMALAGERAGGALVFLYGALVVGLVAGSTGGYLPIAQAWTAFLTLAVATIALVVRDRVSFGVLEGLFLGGLLDFTGWVALSNLWSPSVPSTMEDLQRDLAYVGVIAAGLLLTSRRTVPHLLGGVLTGVTLLSLYALGTRLLPDRFGAFDSVDFGYRLAAPITYWNALGLFCVLGILLALGVAARARGLVTRVLAAAALPILTTTMFFTFSRGAWIALAVGLVVSVAVDPRRLQFAAFALVLAPWSTLAIGVAHRRPALTTVGSTYGDAIDQGRTLVWPLVFLVVLSALVAVAAAIVERRLRIPRAARLAFATVLVACLVAGGGVGWAHWGSPVHIAQRVWNGFRAAPTVSDLNQSQRLFQFSSNGRIDLWRTSWHSFERHPLLGTGAGTFAQEWVRTRPVALDSQQGHSLYAETLGELGVPGLVLLLVALSAPLIAGFRTRGSPLTGAALGAFAAFLVHAGIDWDWELLGVGGTAALIGVALVRQHDPDSRATRQTRWVGATFATGLCAVALLGLVGQQALSSATTALQRADYPLALSRLDRAARFQPWSSRPDELRASVWLAQHNKERARAAYESAVSKDRSNWLLWSSLENVSTGNARQQAVDQLRILNPLEPH